MPALQDVDFDALIFAGGAVATGLVLLAFPAFALLVALYAFVALMQRDPGDTDELKPPAAAG